jgi:5-methylcytosine-specific restriction protein A
MDHIEAAYDVANQVFEREIEIETGAYSLQNIYGLNINSARYFINAYRFMLQGEIFRRGMSASAMNYFLMRIAKDRGLSALSNAIKAVHTHIEYYEGIRKVNLHAMREVVSRHEARMAVPEFLAHHESKFNAQVKKAFNDSPSKRRIRLQDAAKMPVKVCAITEIYLRNPDVVAEVLHRASGVCERCCKPAPFIRKKDGAPYLEVHHKKQLARGGEDTMENTVALCANCHRELHYGAEHA